MQMPGHHVPDVVHLAAFSADDRLDMLRPTPAWLEYGPPDSSSPSSTRSMWAFSTVRTSSGRSKRLRRSCMEQIVRIGARSVIGASAVNDPIDKPSDRSNNGGMTTADKRFRLEYNGQFLELSAPATASELKWRSSWTGIGWRAAVSAVS